MKYCSQVASSFFWHTRFITKGIWKFEVTASYVCYQWGDHLNAQLNEICITSALYFRNYLTHSLTHSTTHPPTWRKYDYWTSVSSRHQRVIARLAYRSGKDLAISKARVNWNGMFYITNASQSSDEATVIPKCQEAQFTACSVAFTHRLVFIPRPHSFLFTLFACITQRLHFCYLRLEQFYQVAFIS